MSKYLANTAVYPLLFIVLAVTFIWGQTALPTLEELEEQKRKRFGTPTTETMYDACLDPQSVVGKACMEARRQYYLHNARLFEEEVKIFEWQRISSVVIFGTVMLLVLCGTVFAAIQFSYTLRYSPGGSHIQESRDAAQKTAGESSVSTLATEVEISLERIKLSSSVLGLLVLALSMAFFYLYVIHIFPVRSLEAPRSVPATSTHQEPAGTGSK